MIVVSPCQTIELTNYFINNFAVDTSRIYAAGFSAGSETMSKAKIPVYISMAQSDEYYGSQIAQRAYDGLKQAYENAGLTQVV